MTTYIRTILCILLFILWGKAQANTGAYHGQNPFLPMIGKPYAQYAKEMKDIRTRLDFDMEQPQADSLMEYMRQAVRIAGNKHWELEAGLLEVTYRFRYKTRNNVESDYTAQDRVSDYTKLIEQASEAKDTLMHLRLQRDLMNAYYLFAKNYAMAFDIALDLKNELSSISADSLPDKLLAYRDMANMFYRFRDYDEAEELYNKIIAEPGMANHLHLLQTTYNGLGLIQHYHRNDLEAAERYFRMITQIVPEGNESELHLTTWEGIASGNLGHCLYKQKKYNEAIPLLEFACERIMFVNDYPFAAGMAILLANIYLEQGKTTRSKHYIDLANEYIGRFYLKPNKEKLYEVMSKYYTTIGNSRLAIAYMDSTSRANEANNREFSALELKRSEQRAHILEQKTKEEELRIGRMRAESYRRIAFIVTIGLLLVSGLLVSTILLYRRKRSAYRALVRKTQQWAEARKAKPLIVETVAIPDPEAGHPEPDESEEALMNRIRHLIEDGQAFVDPGLTLSEVATRLKVNRSYISATINHCTGHNFNHFVNEYRISEAVRIMSDPENAMLTIDAIAYTSGFNDRKSFYRVFKSITGLAPSVFRENIISGEDEIVSEGIVDVL